MDVEVQLYSSNAAVVLWRPKIMVGCCGEDSYREKSYNSNAVCSYRGYRLSALCVCRK